MITANCFNVHAPYSQQLMFWLLVVLCCRTTLL
jgi:hypothetical protein